MKKLSLAIIVYLFLFILSSNSLAADSPATKTCTEALQASVFDQAVNNLEQRFSKLAVLLSKQHPKFEFFLESSNSNGWDIPVSDSDQPLLFPDEDLPIAFGPNGDPEVFPLGTEESGWMQSTEDFSEDSFGPIGNSFQPSKMHSVSIKARRKSGSTEKQKFAKVTLYENLGSDIVIDGLETNSLYSSDQGKSDSAIGSETQEQHSGISLKGFLRIKRWIIQSLKDAGVKSISNSTSVSYEVARFYKYLGMSPVNEEGRLFHEYVGYLYKECRKVKCFDRNDIGSLSLALAGGPFDFNNTKNMLSGNDLARVASFFYLINDSNISDAETLVALSKTVFDKANLGTEVIIDSEGSFLALKLIKNGVSYIKFRTPDAIEAINPEISKLLSWGAPGISNLSMSLQD